MTRGIGGSWRMAASALALALLSACGGGGGVSSTPTPTPSPTPSPTPAPAPTPSPTINYDTPEYRNSTGPSFHGAITAYQQDANGTGVTVGVIDTGLSDPTGELTGRISAASRAFAGNASFADADGHGTAVTMALAAGRNDRAILGVAWNATVMALRADTTTGCQGGDRCFFTSALASALDHAVANGARVVNMSLGGDPATNDLRQAVSRATAAGTIIVISAGNEGEDAPDPLARSLADPAVSHGLVIIAAAVNGNGQRATFLDGASNGALGFEGATIAALGIGVRSLDQNGTVGLWAGTSLSAPLVSGAIALLAQAFPNLTSAQIVQRLLETAQDAGATGPDSIYGMGILDLARAFAPAGTLSLAGTATAVAPGATSSLSSAMGDAMAAGQPLSAVVTDSYGRAYRADVGGAIRFAAPELRLAGGLATRQRHLSAAAGNMHVALSLLPSSASEVEARHLLLSEQEARGARLLAGRIAARIAPGTDLALGIATGLRDLADMQAGPASAPFLVARDDRLLTAAFRAEHALRLRTALPGGWALIAAGEQGKVATEEPRLRRVEGPDGTYAAFGLGLERAFGPLALSAMATRITESHSTLGARLAPLFGGQRATTTLASLSARLSPGGGWTLAGDWRRAWTRAAAGGALREGGRLVSQAWSVEATRAGLLSASDRLSVRYMRPLRVIASAFPLSLPDSYDYATQSAGESIAWLDLVPRGRERDVEVAWSTPLARGWFSANLYHRAQPGNVAAIARDVGGAVRFDLSF